MPFVQYADLKKTLTTEPRPLPPSKGLVFGEQFADHMLTVEWREEKGWGPPEIKPLENLSLHPGASVLHYGIEVGESSSTHCLVCGLVCLKYVPYYNDKQSSSKQSWC